MNRRTRYFSTRHLLLATSFDHSRRSIFLDSGGHYRGIRGPIQPTYREGLVEHINLRRALFNMTQDPIQLIQAVVGQHEFASAFSAVLDLHGCAQAL